MKKGLRTKEHLIQCAALLFWRSGYNATGINDILNTSGLTKGSFYFYFKSKKELAAAVIAYYRRAVYQWLEEMAEGKSWEDFVHAFSSAMVQSAESGSHQGCPFAVMGMETAFSEPDVAAAYAREMEHGTALFQAVLERSSLSAGQAGPLADRLFAIYEGKLLLYRISQDADHLKDMERHLIQTYREYTAHGHDHLEKGGI